MTGTRHDSRSFWIALMYHDVLPGGKGGDHFAVPAERFGEHLAEIGATGYRGVSLGEALSGDVDRPVAITFDDATSSQVEEAFPRLLEHGMSATFFVVTDWVGRPGYASWDDLERLRVHGMEVQSHTHTHPFLSELSREELEMELRRSRQMLNERLDQRTHILALPGGDFPARSMRQAIGQARYDAVATSIFGRNPPDGPPDSSPRYIRRCTVRGDVNAGWLSPVLAGDRLLFARHQLRELGLRNLRRSLGPSRYARWRRRFLDILL